MNKTEKRFIELRAISEDSRTIAGTAIVFNQPSADLGGFVEVILPSAATPEFLASCDIVMLYNHEEDSGVLARSKKGVGSLKYTVDEVGVHFEFEAKQTALGEEVLASVRQGDLSACSFAFCVAEGGDSWENMGNGTYLRTISKFENIKDFSIVITPAYETTEVNTRGLESLKENELEHHLAEERNTQELNEYWADLEDEIAKLTN